MVLDVADFTFGTLVIDGTLKIDDSIAHTTIKANNIWVRGGKLVAGIPEFPYNKKLDIELYGNRYNNPIVIDDVSRTGTKSLAVTGKLHLFGQYPEIIRTRLTAIAR